MTSSSLINLMISILPCPLSEARGQSRYSLFAGESLLKREAWKSASRRLQGAWGAGANIAW